MNEQIFCIASIKRRVIYNDRIFGRVYHSCSLSLMFISSQKSSISFTLGISSNFEISFPDKFFDGLSKCVSMLGLISRVFTITDKKGCFDVYVVLN